jgi:hypothetical protein
MDSDDEGVVDVRLVEWVTKADVNEPLDARDNKSKREILIARSLVKIMKLSE